MRSLHLCFWLHRPYELQDTGLWEKKGYFGGEAEFKAADKRDYQPFFALLERNAQRYPKLHVSLVVSGVWLEQAERWDQELIKRLKKLVQNGNVELVATPYYYSMAVFYDMDELAVQVRQYQDKIETLFGVKSRTLALPEGVFHNKIARWAEKAGMRLMLAGDAEQALKWRSGNYLYDVKGCEELKVAFDNSPLSAMIAQAQTGAVTQVETVVKIKDQDADVVTDNDGGKVASAADFVRAMSQAEVRKTEAETEKVSMKKVFSAAKYQKQLDLAFLRGDLVNVNLPVEVFGQRRELGVIGFFDELFKIWMERPGGRLVGAQEVAELAAKGEISVKKTVSLVGEAEKDYQMPAWWGVEKQENSKKLYELGKAIRAAQEKDLYVDFARLTAVDYAEGSDVYGRIWRDLEKRAKVAAVKTDTTDEQGVKDELTESTAVKVKFHKREEKAEEEAPNEDLYEKVKEAASQQEQPFWDAADIDDMEAAIQVMVQRMKRSQMGEERDFDDLAEAEVIEDMDEVDLAEEILAEEAMEEELQPASKKRKRKKIVID